MHRENQQILAKHIFQRQDIMNWVLFLIIEFILNRMKK